MLKSMKAFYENSRLELKRNKINAQCIIHNAQFRRKIIDAKSRAKVRIKLQRFLLSTQNSALRTEVLSWKTLWGGYHLVV